MTAFAGYAGAALRADELLETALRRRQRDFADRSFVPALEQLLESCNHEADLSAFGSHVLKVDLLRCLRNLLLLEEVESNCPAVLTRPIRSPVFITGMPRSGTTFLHRLILQDPELAAPRLFQLVCPCASPNRWAAALRKTWASVQLQLFHAIVPDFQALHPMAVDAAEECADIMAQVFRSLRFDAMYRVPSYVAWLHHGGFLDAYRFHRRFLQHLDAQLPGGQSGRWVLKCPDHVFALHDLKRVYPDARLVCLHRDPVRVLASVATLTQTLRRAFARRADRAEVGRDVLAYWLDGAECMTRLAASTEPVLHLHYWQIAAAPMEAVGAVYRHCGLTLTAGSEQRMRAWLARRENVTWQPSRNYGLADFGLDSCALREQFAHYVSTFDIDTQLEAEVPSDLLD